MWSTLTQWSDVSIATGCAKWQVKEQFQREFTEEVVTRINALYGSFLKKKTDFAINANMIGGGGLAKKRWSNKYKRIPLAVDLVCDGLYITILTE